MNMFFRISQLSLVLFLFIAVLLSACKKKEIPGPKGEPGAPGGGGNSNITTTAAFSVFSSDWVADSTAGIWKAIVKNTIVTKQAVEKGSVKVYIQSASDWLELPYFLEDVATQFSFKEGTVTLNVTDLHGTLPDKPTTANYRLVVINEI